MMDSDSSPKWTNPSNTIKVKKRRRTLVATEKNALCSKLNSLNTNERISAKRKNPFSCSQINKKLIQDDQATCADDSCSKRTSEKNELFQRLNQASTENPSSLPIQCTKAENKDFDEMQHENQETTKEQSIDKQESKSQCTIQDNFPIDWSIKTRLRFTSEKSFNWCSSLKSSDEASGMSAFVQCNHEKIPDLKKEQFNQTQEITSHLKSMFHQHTMVWVHPSIPWFKSFPRIVPEPKIVKPSFAVANEVVEKSLFTSWCESFRSVFHLLRAKRCPYFYLCAHQFTILFKAVGIGGSKQIHAVITPTTRGFRDALTREGIEFSLPSLQLGSDEKSLSVSPDISQSNAEALSCKTEFSENTCLSKEIVDDDDEEEDITHDDEAASSWIQSIGLDKKEFPSLDPAKVKLQRDKVVKLDHKPQSLVLVQGPDTQALFNFLLNSSTVVAVAGSQAGIPPTLLAPVAFEGATLQKCKVRNSVIKHKATSGALESINSVEIYGVLLPNQVKGLCEMLKQTQTGSYTVSLNVHELTAPFNQVQSHTANESTDNSQLVQCGVNERMLDELYDGEKLTKGFIREIVCRNGKYSWSC